MTNTNNEITNIPQLVASLSRKELVAIIEDMTPWHSGQTLGYDLDGLGRLAMESCGIEATVTSLSDFYKALCVRLALESLRLAS